MEQHDRVTKWALGVRVMNCMACGRAMSIIAVEAHEGIAVAGFCYRVWKCGSCGEIERQTFFDPLKDQTASPPSAPSPDVHPSPTHDKGAALFKKFVGRWAPK